MKGGSWPWKVLFKAEEILSSKSLVGGLTNKVLHSFLEWCTYFLATDARTELGRCFGMCKSNGLGRVKLVHLN